MKYSDYVTFLFGKVLDKALYVVTRTVPAEPREYHADFCHSAFIGQILRVSPVDRDLPTIRHLNNVSFIRDLYFTILCKVDVPKLLERSMGKEVKSRDILPNVPVTYLQNLFVLFCLLIYEFGLRPILRLEIRIGCGTYG